MARFNFVAGTDQEGMEWYIKEYLLPICAIPGVYRGRLYEIIASLDLPSGQAWQEVQRTREPTQAMLKKRQDPYEELSWLEFLMYAPERN